MKGFTLIETVIVIAFSAVMMLALALLAYNFNKISVYNTTSSQSSVSANALMRELQALVPQADAVLATHTFTASTRTSSSTTLVLEIPSIDISGNVIASAYDYGAFYVIGTKAYRLLETNASSKRASGTKLLSSTISSLTFAYNGFTFATTSTVTVDIQTRATAKQDVITGHLHGLIQLRNY